MEVRLALTLALCLPVLASAVNILGLMPVPSPSHHNWNRHIFYKLAEKGYNLTVLSPDVDKEVTPGLHYIWAEKVYPGLYNGSAAYNFSDMLGENTFKGTISVYDFFLQACPMYYESEGFKRLLAYPDDFKFDLVLVDVTMEPCLLGFLEKFKYPPTVGLTAFSVPHYIYDYIGGIKLPSYVPHFEANLGFNMNFCQRLENFVYYVFDDFYRKLYVNPIKEQGMRKAFRNPGLSIQKLQNHIMLLLANTHFAIEKTEPMPPNIISVGGLQIQEAKPLAKELEDFANSAKKGVVLFSLGTNMKSDMIDDSKKRQFIEAFRQLPDYNFIWKYESDLGIELPKNVKTVGWVRQNDILAHKKTKAFISHCGLLGTQEAAWHGIPVVGLPFFADQFKNLQSGIRSQTAVGLDYFALSTDVIRDALKQVLENPVYFKNAQVKSKLIQDRPQKPIDTALFWIEWAMRHKDDYHAIKLPIRELGIIASNSYDVIIFLLAILFIVLYAVTKVLCLICGTRKAPVKKLKRN